MPSDLLTKDAYNIYTLIVDDGKGFDTQFPVNPADQSGGGFGLQVMRQRVEQLGGRMILESSTGEGTTLVVQIPVIPNESQTREEIA